MALMRRQSLVKFDAPLCETLVDTPKPQGREVLVRVERCGLYHLNNVDFVCVFFYVLLLKTQSCCPPAPETARAEAHAGGVGRPPRRDAEAHAGDPGVLQRLHHRPPHRADGLPGSGAGDGGGRAGMGGVAPFEASQARCGCRGLRRAPADIRRRRRRPGAGSGRPRPRRGRPPPPAVPPRSSARSPCAPLGSGPGRRRSTRSSRASSPGMTSSNRGEASSLWRNTS